MPNQFPLVVRYDNEGRPNGLREAGEVSLSAVSATTVSALTVTVGTISASVYQGIDAESYPTDPATGPGVWAASTLSSIASTVSENYSDLYVPLAAAATKQIYFNNDGIADGITVPTDGSYLRYTDALGYYWVALEVTGGITDHGALDGLNDNDHPQYASSAVSATIQAIDSELNTFQSEVAADFSYISAEVTGVNNTLTSFQSQTNANFSYVSAEVTGVKSTLTSHLADSSPHTGIFVRVDSVTGPEIYFRASVGTPDGISVAGGDVNKFLKYQGGDTPYVWDAPAGTSYPTNPTGEPTTAVGVWNGDGLKFYLDNYFPYTSAVDNNFSYISAEVTGVKTSLTSFQSQTNANFSYVSAEVTGVKTTLTNHLTDNGAHTGIFVRVDAVTAPELYFRTNDGIDGVEVKVGDIGKYLRYTGTSPFYDWGSPPGTTYEQDPTGVGTVGVWTRTGLKNYIDDDFAYASTVNANFSYVSAEVTGVKTSLTSFQSQTNANFSYVSAEVTGVKTSLTSFQSQTNANFSYVSAEVTGVKDTLTNHLTDNGAHTGVFVRVDAVTGPEIYYRTGAGTPDGIVATVADSGKFLKYTDGGTPPYTWIDPLTAIPVDPVDPSIAALWRKNSLDDFFPYASAVTANLSYISGEVTAINASLTNYVNVSGDTMTGDLLIDGTHSIKFTNSLGGISAINNINFYSPTTFFASTLGLSAININSYTNTVVGVTAPFTPTDFGYNHASVGANYNLDVLTYLRQLDRLLYRHAENNNNPTEDATVGHWSVAGIRNRANNIVSATPLSSLSSAYLDDLDDVSLAALSEGDILSYVDGFWTNKPLDIIAPGGIFGFDNPDEYLGNLIYASGDPIRFVVYDLKLSAVDRHVSSTLGIDGSAVHHYLSSLDQRYLPASGVFSGVVAVQALSSVDYIEFDLSANVTREEGRLYWNDTYKTLELDSSNQTFIFLGQEVVVRVLNNTAQTFTRGQVVYISGTESNIPTIALATASAEATTHKGLGVLKQTLGPTDRGLMSIFGKVSGIDTSIYNIGDILYLGTTPGSLTNVYSPAPSHPELIGSVVTVGTSSTGVVLVQVQHGYEIQELHNVSRTEPSATGQVLVWNNTSGYYAPGSHNDLAGLTTGNPHTQYATLSGCNFTGTVSATTVSATTYQNIPKQVRPISINIENPSANMIIPLFYGEGYIDTINQINSVIIGGTSATWSIYQAADVSNPDDVGNTVLYDTEVTDSTTGGNTHPINVSFSEDWIVLVFKSVSGAVSRLHLTVFVS